MIEATLFARIKAAHSNTFPLKAPENVSLPCVIYQRISTVPTRDMSGADGTADFVFQVDSYATTYLAAKQLAQTMRHQLEGWAASGVQTCAFIGESDMIDDTTQIEIFRVMQEYRLFASLD